MIKKSMWVQRKTFSNKDIKIIKVASHTTFIRHKSSLSNYILEVKNKFDIDPILKWEIMKRCSKYKGRIDIVNYV